MQHSYCRFLSTKYLLSVKNQVIMSKKFYGFFRCSSCNGRWESANVYCLPETTEVRLSKHLRFFQKQKLFDNIRIYRIECDIIRREHLPPSCCLSLLFPVFFIQYFVRYEMEFSFIDDMLVFYVLWHFISRCNRLLFPYYTRHHNHIYMNDDII